VLTDNSEKLGSRTFLPQEKQTRSSFSCWPSL
jgi:hypothetical protein